ncbi:MAG: glycoside hydrolase family 15 protein [Planctomycetaceae bacterium]|nr:glycoside hydrolase family 15 protein [Planctomycetaceae bacterium]
MQARIEDYGLIGDCHAAALVERGGSIDWLCLPRFDSKACFAALLGTPEHGRWFIGPAAPARSVRRRYRDGTLVLETEHELESGTVRVIDFMPPRTDAADVVRIVEGVRGSVPMRLEIEVGFDYGSVVPWVHCEGGVLTATGGPDRLTLTGPVRLHGRGLQTVAEFDVVEGQRVPFDLVWSPSHLEVPPRIDAEASLEQTVTWWREWSGKCTYEGRWRDGVLRSLITLKALTYAPTGGIVAAPTTSLPEHIGGVRNWDYRYCWLRDATFTLYSLLMSGYRDEAKAWREWLLRAVAGRPSQLHVLYGLEGERRIEESILPWLPGYENSRPVRVGNAAYSQVQIDIFGEVIDTFYQGWRAGIASGTDDLRLERAILGHLETAWKEPDEGVWEVRGPRRHFTHSKVMAWVAFDRAVKGAENYQLKGPLDRWRALRDQIHEDICRQGWNPNRNAFVQSYGSECLDASLLTIPLVGFLSPDDPRVRLTVEAIGRELQIDGFVHRYASDPAIDGLPNGEGSFLLCTFWYADVLHLMGRHEEALRVFERILQIRNDLGLLSEGYDVSRGRLVGNFPQAFSHVGLVNTAFNLSRHGGPAEERPRA